MQSKSSIRFKNQKALNLKAPQVPDLQALLAGGSAPPSTFGDFTRKWQAERRIEWRKGHQENVEVILTAHLIPFLGELRIDQITREVILAFRSWLAQPYTFQKRAPAIRNNATINRIMAVLNQVMVEANIRFGVENPLPGVKRLKHQSKIVEPFTIDEMNRILAAAGTYRHYLTTRFMTGLRSAEVNGLKWKHIDFDRGVILVRESLIRGRVEGLKTAGARRDVRMAPPVIEALLALRGPAANADAYVFTGSRGRPLNNGNFTKRVWFPLLKRLGISARRPYQMRHTAATLWLASGENPEWIAKQLGHSDTLMLFKVYSRFVPNLTRQDGSAIDALLARSLKPTPSPTAVTNLNSSASTP